ncbi:MAG: DUF1624 domain-containing protein [Algicola sp.]|nr:DUF1624 domain-containing protein [Algicola sp.]
MTDILQKRLIAIDILRGLIIVLMALDHTRDFWGAAGFNPTDLSQTTPAWFFTRWVTHFCAPLFVFLTGVSAMLYSQKLESKAQLRNYLLSRGLWLIVLEIAVINLSWQVGYSFTFVQVIWVLGMSMVILSGLIYLPKRWILALTLPFLLLHNAIDDNAVAAALGSADWLWKILHMSHGITLDSINHRIIVVYPLIPWFSVMALGYVIGELFLKPQPQRQKTLLLIGSGMVLAFIVLRATGLYGDSSVYQSQDTVLFSILSFINTTKYPASLQFILMTIGPGLILLALLDKVNVEGKIYPALHWLKVFGSVPLFFYLIHVPVINASAHLYTWLRYGEAVNFFGGISAAPEGYEPSLLLAFIAWAGLVALLYYPCKQFGLLKRRSNNLILSYL